MNRHDQMRDQCRSFHHDHPEVWTLFCRFTFERIDRGFEHYSSRGIWERIRWDTDQAEPHTDSTFKLNNNHKAFYARRFMKMYPEHDGFFRLRKQTSRDSSPAALPALGPINFD